MTANENKLPDEVLKLVLNQEDLPPAETPTKARPGTPEKLETMIKRLESGHAIGNPDDATWDGAIGAIQPGRGQGKEPHRKSK